MYFFNDQRLCIDRACTVQGKNAHLRSPAIRVKLKKGRGQRYIPCAGLLSPDLYDSRCLRHLTSGSSEHNEEASLFAKTGSFLI